MSSPEISLDELLAWFRDFSNRIPEEDLSKLNLFVKLIRVRSAERETEAFNLGKEAKNSTHQ